MPGYVGTNNKQANEEFSCSAQSPKQKKKKLLIFLKKVKDTANADIKNYLSRNIYKSTKDIFVSKVDTYHFLI